MEYRIQVSDEGNAFLDNMDADSNIKFTSLIGKVTAWLLEIREEEDFIGPTQRFIKRGDHGPDERNEADIAYDWAMTRGYLEKVEIPTSRRMLESITTAGRDSYLKMPLHRKYQFRG